MNKKILNNLVINLRKINFFLLTFCTVNWLRTWIISIFIKMSTQWHHYSMDPSLEEFISSKDFSLTNLRHRKRLNILSNQKKKFNSIQMYWMWNVIIQKKTYFVPQFQLMNEPSIKMFMPWKSPFRKEKNGSGKRTNEKKVIFFIKF